MNCPYCNFKFKTVSFIGDTAPELAPFLCEACAEVSLYEKGTIRRISADELQALKESPVWKEMIVPTQNVIHTNNAKGGQRWMN